MLSIKRILTIEDDQDYQLILTRYLEMLNVPERAVDTANDLSTGLQLLEEVNDVGGAVSVRNTLAAVYVRQGQVEEAFELFEQ